MLFLEFIRPHGWAALLLLLAASTAVCCRFGGRGFLVVLTLTGLAYGWLDYVWLRDAMAAPGWDGTPDADALFMFGVFLRIACVSVLLLGTLFLGLWISRRHYSNAPPIVDEPG